MHDCSIQFDIVNPAAEIQINVCVDDRVIPLVDTEHFTHTFSDDKDEHCLQITMSGKTNECANALVEIKNFKLCNVPIDQLVYEHSMYEHNFNGNGATVKEPFFGTLGCNGTVTFNFTTPAYDWIVNNS